MSHLLQPETPRLLLRQWQSKDYPAFAALNTDPEVMRYFPAPLTTEQSDAVAQLCQQLIGMFGWGFWAVMQRLDMQPDGAFEHPALPQGHPLRQHLLYRKSNPSLTTAAA
ncbi:MAG: GNAT family N-acetyltransferase [Marinospirillum sp.]|uniref:GNAT family N-acetyltransferase n=1 Tax=Marinospirillum sp. TaxID=2183934 RepID=UPI001A0D34C9|nr:GNAT family N-acetyltransferase [Marinospirillum sp.]MBE0505846.1 GNAT family N-acetyltransferase [Marinospirillum sp.]